MMYEISWESVSGSGSWSVLAASSEEALALFDECWLEHDGEVPSQWLTGCWSVN